MVVHGYNPSSSGDTDPKNHAQDQPGQKVSENPISASKLSVVACACDPSYMEGVGRIVVWGQSQAKTWEFIWKITKAKKRLGDMAQAVDHLPSRHKVLSSYPNTAF
jgi:hypothetical protein